MFIAAGEHTVYFHSPSHSGDVDVRLDVDNLYMDAEEPTEPASKVKLNKAVIANEAANKNSLMSAWVLYLDEPQRIVCAATTFYGVADGDFTVQLFVDQPRGLDSTEAARTTASGSGAGVSTYTGTFGPLDVEGDWELVLQLGAPVVAPVLYDSTTHRRRSPT